MIAKAFDENKQLGSAGLMIVMILGVSSAAILASRMNQSIGLQKEVDKMAANALHRSANQEAVSRFAAMVDELDDSTAIADKSIWPVVHLGDVSSQALAAYYSGASQEKPGLKYAKIQVIDRNLEEGILKVEVTSPEVDGYSLTEQAVLPIKVPMTADELQCAEVLQLGNQKFKTYKIEGKRLKRASFSYPDKNIILEVNMTRVIKKFKLRFTHPEPNVCLKMSARRIVLADVDIPAKGNLAEIGIDAIVMKRSKIAGNEIKVKGRKVKKTKLTAKKIEIDARKIKKNLIQAEQVDLKGRKVKLNVVEADKVDIDAQREVYNQVNGDPNSRLAQWAKRRFGR